MAPGGSRPIETWRLLTLLGEPPYIEPSFFILMRASKRDSIGTRRDRHREREPTRLVGRRELALDWGALGLGLLGLGLLGAALDASADEVAVPVPLQMKLLAKVAGYDKNLPARAGDKVHVLVLTKAKNADSDRVSSQALAALGEIPDIAGLSVVAGTDTFTSAADLKKAISKRRLAVVYLSLGFSRDEVESIATTLDGVDILTATAVPSDVARGVVLGFDLVSSKPKLLVHLKQAKKQRVALSAEVLKLAQVVE